MKKRKYRDMCCTIFFIIFWLGIIAILVYGSKLPVKGELPMLERAFLYARPGDKIRRMCGYSIKEQPDKLALDYSSYVMSDSQTKLFCEMMKTAHGDNAELAGIDCGNLKTAETMRPFLSSLKSEYLDMTGYKNGLRSMQQTVCIDTPCAKIPADAKYVCHREFLDLAKIVNNDDSVDS